MNHALAYRLVQIGHNISLNGIHTDTIGHSIPLPDVNNGTNCTQSTIDWHSILLAAAMSPCYC